MKKSYLICFSLAVYLFSSLGLCIGQNKEEKDQKATLLKRGRSIEEIVPKDWSTVYEQGDLNNDGIADIVLITQPNYKEKISVLDDGRKFNYNDNILAIYFGTKSGEYENFRILNEVIPVSQDEFVYYEATLSITEKGVLRINTSFFASAGTYSVSNTTYLFRFQSDDFYLIGKETSGLSRSTGESVVESYNFLTAKVCITTGNVFEKVKEKVVWKKLVKRRLNPLGASYLYP